MLAYVDESGCLGTKFGQGSSEFFAVATVPFRDREIARACRAMLSRLRLEARIGKEFHFTKCSDSQRVRFFSQVNKFDFEYVGVVFDKARMIECGFGFEQPFLQFPVKGLFAQIGSNVDGVDVMIDRTGSNEFRQMIQRDLKKDINEQFGREVIKRVSSQASHAEPLLQLADMVVGALMRLYKTDGPKSDVYRKLLKRKEVAVIDWPGA